MGYRLTGFVLMTMAGCALLLDSGCAVLGVAAHAMPPATIRPSYTGLAGKSVGVMVWADRGVRIDFPTLQVDLANAIQSRLRKAAPHTKELKGASFPVEPASIVRYQQDHPEIEGMPITSVAPKLGVERLIYVEIEAFSTRSDLTVDLFRGTGVATVKVLEVSDGKAKIGYDESAIEVHFPPDAPREGIPNVGDYRIYVGTINALATQIANRFLPHSEAEQ